MKDKSNVGLAILAGIGVGVVAGITAGIILAARKRPETEEITDSVEQLRGRTERVLLELSESISDLRERAKRMADDAGVPSR
ncbi:MAG: hypothetical protein ACLQVD_00795 [Capsulimonadaceae bacterium]